jgi:glycosyltransferase involved in cell wall biosynthesis
VAAELDAYGIDRSQVAVLGNAVDAALFSPNGTKANTSPPYILTAGRLAPRKGLEDLIQCAQLVRLQIPSVRFLVAGSGPLEGALRNEIARRDMKANVILLGHIADHRQMVELYRGAAAYLHPAHYEGLPTVLLEAMACGRPVVATAVSGALDVIQDGGNGLLAPPHCPQQLASAVLRLLQDPRQGELLGAAALDTIQQRYSWEIVGSSYLAQYRELLSGMDRVANA